MTTPPAITMSKHVDLPYAEAVERITAALRDEGFGILTEIDVRATMRAKLDVDFRPYVILGACNPPLAHRALETSLEVGALLPCNVVVYATEADGSGGAVISIFDPAAGMSALNLDALGPIADDARARLQRALAAV